MNNTRLLVALGVVLLLGGGIYVSSRHPDGDPVAQLTDPWARIDRTAVTRIVVTRPGTEPAVELEKRDGHWFMNRPARGPADEQAVSDALEVLTEMHVASVAAREAASYGELEVDDAHAIRVQVFRGGSEALNVLVGKNLDGGSAVRLPGRPEVFRVTRALRYALTKEVREWRDRAITHLERAHVQSVEWRGGSLASAVRFTRNGDTWSAGEGTTIERLDTARVNQMVTNLLDLRASDFAAENATTGFADANGRVTINVDNGSPITLIAGGNNGESESYVRRDGTDIAYVVRRTQANDIAPALTAFQSPPPPEAGAGDATAEGGAAPAAPSGMPMMLGGPGGMPGAGGPPGAGGAPGGGQQIPPEVMEQIRRQLQQQAGAAGGH